MNCWELRVILLVILTEALHFYFSLDAKVHTASKALVTTVLMGEYELSVGERWATPRPKRVNQIDESSGQKCLHRMSILPAGWFTERATCTKLSPWLVDWLRRPGQNSDILPLTTVPKSRRAVQIALQNLRSHLYRWLSIQTWRLCCANRVRC